MGEMVDINIMRHPNYALTAALFFLGIGLVPASAQERPDGFSIGLAVAGGNNIYVGESDDISALPLLRYDSDAFSIGLPDGLTVKLFGANDFEIGAALSPRLFALVDTDASELRGIDRDITVDGGLQARYAFTQQTTLLARAVTEVTDEHGGSEVEIALRHAVPVGRAAFSVEAGATWQSADLSTYLYGVRGSEAISGRAAYDPGDVIVPHLSLGAVYPLNDRMRIVSSIRAEFLPDEVQDSPIVSEDISIGAMIGVSYSF
ncbi:MipA/OmpV family protein [Celeribacter sp. ULVN23_4]